MAHMTRVSTSDSEISNVLWVVPKILGPFGYELYYGTY